MPGFAASMTRFVVERYDRKSAIAFGLLVTTAASVGYRWSDLVDIEGNMDWLLAGIWVFMAALICWNVSPRRDLILVGTGLCGGAVIEWWGTTTELWAYFTDERPPPWILPAWPCAAIAIDRLAKLVGQILTEIEERRGVAIAAGHLRGFYWFVVPAFVIWMTSFLYPAIHKPASMAVVAIMLAVLLRPKSYRADFTLFVAGSMLGVFLEYWGTSRECWTYYTRETPPAVAVFAHGFAAIAFGRVADFVGRVADSILPIDRKDEGHAQSLKARS